MEIYAYDVIKSADMEKNVIKQVIQQRAIERAHMIMYSRKKAVPCANRPSPSSKEYPKISTVQILQKLRSQLPVVDNISSTLSLNFGNDRMVCDLDFENNENCQNTGRNPPEIALSENSFVTDKPKSEPFIPQQPPTMEIEKENGGHGSSNDKTAANGAEFTAECELLKEAQTQGYIAEGNRDMWQTLTSFADDSNEKQIDCYNENESAKSVGLTAGRNFNSIDASNDKRRDDVKSKTCLNNAEKPIHFRTPNDLWIQTSRPHSAPCRTVTRVCCEVLGQHMCHECWQLRLQLYQEHRSHAPFENLDSSTVNFSTSTLAKRALPRESLRSIQEKVAKGQIKKSYLGKLLTKRAEGQNISTNDRRPSSGIDENNSKALNYWDLQKRINQRHDLTRKHTRYRKTVMDIIYPAFVSPKKATISPMMAPVYIGYHSPPLLEKHRQRSEPAFYAGTKEAYTLPTRLPVNIVFDSEGGPVKRRTKSRSHDTFSDQSPAPALEYEATYTDTIENFIKFYT